MGAAALGGCRRPALDLVLFGAAALSFLDTEVPVSEDLPESPERPESTGAVGVVLTGEAVVIPGEPAGCEDDEVGEG